MDQCTANDWGYSLAGTEGIYGVALVLHGDVGAGIRWIKQAISRREQEGYRTLADWYRLFLCEDLSRNHLWQGETPGEGSCTKHADVGGRYVYGSKAHLLACGAGSPKSSI